MEWWITRERRIRQLFFNSSSSAIWLKVNDCSSIHAEIGWRCHHGVGGVTTGLVGSSWRCVGERPGTLSESAAVISPILVTKKGNWGNSFKSIVERKANNSWTGPEITTSTSLSCPRERPTSRKQDLGQLPTSTSPSLNIHRSNLEIQTELHLCLWSA